MPGQCCVFQIFDDGGAYDKRYDEVISPAITAAGLGERCHSTRTTGTLFSMSRSPQGTLNNSKTRSQVV